MSNTAAIHRHSFLFFLAIPVFAVWGFWQTYFVGEIRPISGWDHAHGLSMFGWCGMLVVQSVLIRNGARSTHRALGRLSYALIPFIVFSTLALANQQVNARGTGPEGLYVLMLQITILIQFMIFYAFAIRHKQRPDVHARYMICTALTLIDPIFARILMFHILPAEYLALTQYFTYGLTDLILIALIVWDWRSSGRRDVFLPMLFVMIILQAPTFLFVQSPAWITFANWFAGLPLS